MDSHRPRRLRGVAEERIRSRTEPEQAESQNWAGMLIAGVLAVVGFAAIAAVLWRAVFHHF